MAVVVRCSGCGGLARVGPEAVGLLVVCPRCGNPFLADAVSLPEPAAAPPPPPPPPPPRPIRAEPVAPPRPRRRKPAPELHDHPPPTAGGVPFSVIIGLALLPLTIPMLWLIGPVVVGHAPSLTLATPASLAVSAAVLCLAVAYTVDWSPATRIKGVLILVGLAYFTGMFLYFMKREWAELAQQKLGADDWNLIQPEGEDYEVELPGRPTPLPAGTVGPVPVLKRLSGYRAVSKGFGRVSYYTVGAGADHDLEADDAAWFAAVEKSLAAAPTGWKVGPGRSVPGVTLINREWEATKETDRLVVRVFRDRANGRVYLLAAEGRRVTPTDPEAARFLGSFAVLEPED